MVEAGAPDIGGPGSLVLEAAGIHIEVTPTAPLCSTRGRDLGLGLDFLAEASLERLGTGEGSVAFRGTGGSWSMSRSVMMEEVKDSLLEPS